MDVREKLVELIGSTEYGNGSLVGNNFQKGFIEKIATHLIANGVTVQENVEISDELLKQLKNAPITICKEEPSVELAQEWISVDDELPKEQGYYRVYHKNSKSISDRFYYKDCTDLFVNVMDDPITYWKPIEQPPKGE